MSSGDYWRTALRSLVRRASGFRSAIGSEAPRNSAQATARHSRASGRIPTPAGTSILIVDDDPLVAAALRRVLRGYRVSIALSGDAALAELRAHHFDVVISDVMMPRPAGIDAYRTLQREGSPMAARFIFVTGGGHDADARHFLHETRPPCLPKPVDPGALLSCIRQLIVEAPPVSGRETA